MSAFAKATARQSRKRSGLGLTGLEPVTLRLSSACSNQLSYRPVLGCAVNFQILIANFRFLARCAGQVLKSTIENRKSKMAWRQGDSNP